MSGARLLVVDDDPAVRFAVGEFLTSRGFHVTEAETCSGGVAALLAPERVDVAIFDYSLPDGTALDVLREQRILGNDTPIVVLTGHGSIELAVQAIQQGAHNFLTKPVQLDALLVVVRRILEQRRHRRVASAESRLVPAPLDPFVGTGKASQSLARDARRVASTDAPVLIQGETGTGKGVLARWLHRTSPRGNEPWLELNCATLARELLESELFGHERGAFTGAIASKVGLIEAAEGGTVFLDEIGDMDASVQPKLLKVLEEKRFRRVGDVRERTANVRFIAASHRNLNDLVAQGNFRQDLLFRLNAITLTIPPLRDRREDVPALAVRFLSQIARDLRRHPSVLTPDAMQALSDYGWPGNVRELYNVLERAAILTEGTTLGPEALRLDARRTLTPEAGAADLGLTLDQLQIRHIQRVLELEHGNVGRVAMRLGVPRSTLYQRLQRYGLKTSDNAARG